MAIDGVRFGHVAFKVADVEKSIRWYGDAFGAKPVTFADAFVDQTLRFLAEQRGPAQAVLPTLSSQ